MLPSASRDPPATPTGVSATGNHQGLGDSIWESCTISGFTAGTDYAAANVTRALALTPGAVYSVVWDGVAYRCTCATLPKDSNLSYLGNLHIAGEGNDTTQPFLLVSDGQQVQLLSSQLSKNHHNIAIYAREEALPPVNTDDNGKFLRVVDGAWAAEQLAWAEEVAF